MLMHLRVHHNGLYNVTVLCIIKEKFSVDNESSCPIVPLSASINSNRLIVVFTRSITVEKAVTFFKGIPNDASWRSVSLSLFIYMQIFHCVKVSLFSSLTSRVWECVFNGKEHIQISKDGENFHSFTRFYRKDLYDRCVSYLFPYLVTNFRIVRGGSVDVIDALREHCEELLQEENGNSVSGNVTKDSQHRRGRGGGGPQ